MFKPVRPDTSLTVPPSADPTVSKVKSTPSISQLFAEMRFDLLVLRCSILAEFCALGAVVLGPLPSQDPSTVWWSQAIFIAATSFTSAGAGITPAIQSFALSTLQGRALAEKEIARVRAGLDPAHVRDDHDTEPEPSKVLGAVAVLHATGSTILGVWFFSSISLLSLMFSLAYDLRLDIQQHGCLLPSGYVRGCWWPRLSFYLVYLVHFTNRDHSQV